ncbi:MAG: exo-alpha-sialidase [Candidatus Hydrogenedentes bacterium]|nr:exo-alpha-sialidase [Candidatus Hydrogenedentota bacterium]
MRNAAAVFLGSLIAVFAYAEPTYREELLFPLQPKHVHSSSIAESPNGDLLACWFHGSGERKSPDVIIQGSRLRKGEATWSDAFLLADTPDFPDCNPVLFIDPRNELWLFWIAVLSERWEDSLLRYRKSTDYEGDGPPKWYWQDDMLLKPGKDFAVEVTKGLEAILPQLPAVNEPRGMEFREIVRQVAADALDLSKQQRGWMTRAQVVVLPTGRILIPLYSDGYLLGLMAISDDQGQSWRASSPIPGTALNQPSIARKKDGTLVAYMREEDDIKHRVLTSESKDDGETWSVAQWTDIPNPNSSLVALTLKDGRWILVYNDSEEARDTLVVALSDDEGNSWKWRRHLEKQKGGAFHYPFAIQSKDGLIHVSYTYTPSDDSGHTIKHVAFEADWILVGD